MPSEVLQVINITSTAVGKGIKERYSLEAQRRGKKERPFIAAVIVYACRNKNRFKGPLADVREKGGKHISLRVPQSIKEDLRVWAEQEETTLASLANYILEKALEMDVLKDI
jgi:hypothetical protein